MYRRAQGKRPSFDTYRVDVYYRKLIYDHFASFYSVANDMQIFLRNTYHRIYLFETPSVELITNVFSEYIKE